uniref:Uncharacterized protein n=1 Tax=Siphoviridae sp. ctnPP24 TaxID=2825662 RepID=A0A8S5TYZ5_9CAUD|nr:MAG TPA: hypothetical protein [Siphoviridae sp. ctnPP24]
MLRRERTSSSPFFYRKKYLPHAFTYDIILLNQERGR